MSRDINWRVCTTYSEDESTTGQAYGITLFSMLVCVLFEYVGWPSRLILSWLLCTFKCLCPAFPWKFVKLQRRRTNPWRRTRLKTPEDSACHRFFAPWWVFNFGNWATRDVVNVLDTRGRRMCRSLNSILGFGCHEMKLWMVLPFISLLTCASVANQRLGANVVLVLCRRLSHLTRTYTTTATVIDNE